VARSVEPVAAELGYHGGRIAVVRDTFDVERDVFADELPITPDADRDRADELTAPIVDYTISGEGSEEGLDVVVVGRLEGSCDGFGQRAVNAATLLWCAEPGLAHERPSPSDCDVQDDSETDGVKAGVGDPLRWAC
jgi:hypothetical protein